MLFYVIKYLIDFCFMDIRKYVHSLKTILHVSIESSILTIIQLSIPTTVYQKDPKHQNLPQLCFHPMSSIPWICSSLRPLLGLHPAQCHLSSFNVQSPNSSLVQSQYVDQK